MRWGKGITTMGTGGGLKLIRASDWCALQEALYKCIDKIQYKDIPFKY